MTTAVALPGKAQARAEGKCGAKARSTKKPCGRPAGWGTDHVGFGNCKFHGGSTQIHAAAAAREEAQILAAQYGGPIQIEPHEALLAELCRTAGHVEWLGQKVAELEDHTFAGPVGEEGMDDKTGVMHFPRVEPSVWIRLYQEEREHLVRVAATCIKAGIEERRVRIAEEQGQLMARAIQGILEDLGVADQPGVPKVVRKHLTMVAGGAAE